MSNVTAQATKDGTVMLTIMDGAGQSTQTELAIELIEKLKGQIEAALVLARVRRASIRQRQSGPFGMSTRVQKAP